MHLNESKKDKIGRQLLEIQGTLFLLQHMLDRCGPDDSPLVIDMGDAHEISRVVGRSRRLALKIFDGLSGWQVPA